MPLSASSAIPATHHGSTSQDSDPRVDEAAHELLELFTRFVQQALGGCGDSRCTEVACHTGRVNTSERPVRRYTARSARAVALTICSLPDPRCRLCPYFEPAPDDVGHQPEDKAVGAAAAHDPSNLMQLFCDTNLIARLPQHAATLASDHELGRIHDKVSRMLKLAARLPSLDGEGFLSNSQLADGLFECLEWLLSRTPLQRMAPWKMVNREFISKGYAYPPQHGNLPVDETYNTWLTILDLLEHGPYLYLWKRMLHVIIRRRALQQALGAVATRVGSKTTFKRLDESVPHLLAAKVCRNYASDPTRVLALIVWLKKVFTKTWDSQPMVLEHDPIYAAVEILAQIQDQGIPGLPPDTFYMPFIVSRIGIGELASSFSSEGRKRALHIAQYNAFIAFSDLSLMFRSVNHLTMREAHAAVEKAHALRRRTDLQVQEDLLPEQIQHAEQYYLLLNVSRANVLRDAFDHLWHRRKGELRRPLRVRLGEADELEIGHDLGGVQIEFFNLVCKDAFAEEAQMFTTDSTTGLSYFAPGSLQPLYMFELLGMLMALAVYNGITLPVTLPWVFYALLDGAILPPEYPQLGVSGIQDGWPVVANSLQSILEQDLEGLDFTFPLEANGVRLTVLLPCAGIRKTGERRELKVVSCVGVAGAPVNLDDISESWPGWKLVKATSEDVISDVTPENKHAYVQDYSKFLCYGSVAPQCDAFFRGFYDSSVLDARAIDLFTPEQLKLHIEGSNHIDINDLRSCAKYEGYEPHSRYVSMFWRIVASWPEAKHRQLLKFVTAAERTPITGAKNLTFVIKRNWPGNPDALPTSSTCFGTLYLPKYPSAEVLAAKLNLALKYGTEGFGTG
ncbi:Ubiquitin- ligase E3A [Lecanosticta acicola]|uniref:HECT-type E3 ubiquitin transferase n=1 Tax=Lecanosticta acicola TaxID=111012 RepID=A0AAI9ED17_9PEZI|nr:Ubiquitin- ligase E3A [Lecanosticta acicola]